jgi:TonB family protein
MVKRIVLGLLGLAVIVAVFWTARAEAADFSRPDCSAFKDAPLPENKCFRKNKLAVRYANYAALQKTGLEFVYLARPPSGKELEAYPEAKKAAMDKVEGEFLITFSVNTEGNVYDVKVVQSSSVPIGYLAKLWADTIAQWKFTKIAKPVTDVPFRRLYLYSSEDDDRSKKNGG